MEIRFETCLCGRRHRRAGSGLDAALVESRYEVFAKRDAAYVKSLVREVQSELGKLELLYDGEQLVGIQASGDAKERTAPFVYRNWLLGTGDQETGDHDPDRNTGSVCTSDPLKTGCPDGTASDLPGTGRSADPAKCGTLGVDTKSYGIRTGKTGRSDRYDGGSIGTAPVDERRVLYLRIEAFTAWLFGYRIRRQSGPIRERSRSMC